MTRNYISTIAELLAAASIVLAGLTFVYDYWKSQSTEISTSIITSGSNALSLLISNTGGIDVAIKRVQFLVPNYDIANEVNINQVGVLLKAKETKIINSTNSELNCSVAYVPRELPAHVSVATTECEVKVDFLNVKGKLYNKSFSHTCFTACFG